MFSIFITMGKASYAFWVWTPETNRWENPKYSVKETPAEQLEFAKTFYTSKEYERAVLEFKKLIKHYPRAKEAAEAQYSIGMCLEALGKPLEAFKAYQVVIEKYPDLKASQSFRDLQAQLEGTENRITVARGRYAKSVVEFNKKVRFFPTNLTAQYLLGMKVRENFSADEAAQKPPQVKF